MRYFEFDPAPVLAAHVSCYWGMTVPARTPRGQPHQLTPDGGVAVFCGRSAAGEVRASLAGPRAEALTVLVNPGDRFWGVRFWPDAGGAVLRTDPRKLRNHLVAPLEEPAWAVSLARALAACEDEASAARAANEALAHPVSAAKPLDSVVRAAVVGLMASNGEMEIAELARGVGLSLRHFERRFGAAVGLVPVQFARVRRMRSELAHLLGPAARTWSEVATDLGFADHERLVRDLVQLAGVSPSEAVRNVRSLVSDTPPT